MININNRCTCGVTITLYIYIYIILRVAYIIIIIIIHHRVLLITACLIDTDVGYIDTGSVYICIREL